jgi:hypothetical protein
VGLGHLDHSKENYIFSFRPRKPLSAEQLEWSSGHEARARRHVDRDRPCGNARFLARIRGLCRRIRLAWRLLRVAPR